MDITKCCGGCEKQDECLRYTAQDGIWQSYADFKKDCTTNYYEFFIAGKLQSDTDIHGDKGGIA